VRIKLLDLFNVTRIFQVMTSMDKAAIVFSIAIALVGVGIAAVGDSVDYSPTTTPSVSTPISESETSSGAFGAELSAKIRAEAEAGNSVSADSLQDRQAAADKAAAQAAADKAAAQAAADKAAAQAAATDAAADKAAAQAAADKAAAQAAADKAAAQAAADKAAAQAAADKAAAQAAADKAAAEAAAAPKTVIVDIPVGTAVPGCETTDECFSPARVSINAGDTVEWANIDTAAHTVTGGSPAMGPSGVFDSSLLMASANYAFTFDEAGSYDYFCMVHPWMVGSVSVN
jgi:plastocyanin